MEGIILHFLVRSLFEASTGPIGFYLLIDVTKEVIRLHSQTWSDVFKGKLRSRVANMINSVVGLMDFNSKSSDVEFSV